MKTLLVIALWAALLGLAQGCCGEAPLATGPGRQVELDRAFYHRDAHINLPLHVEDWDRLGITVHQDQKMELSYGRPQTAVTLRIQPASVSHQNLEERFRVLLRSPAWPGDSEGAPQEVDLGPGATPARGLYAVTRRGGQWSYLYLFQQDGWFLYYRVTTEDAEAQEKLLRLLKALHVPDPDAEPRP